MSLLLPRENAALLTRLTGLLLLSALGLSAQRHEIGLTMGRILGPTRESPAGKLELTSGISLQADYGYRVWTGRNVAVSGGLHFLANGQRRVESANTTATRDLATAYFTPNVRVKFAPGRGLSPWVAGGAGYALYEQSFFRIDGASNPAPRFTHRGTLMFGAGADFPLWRFVGGRVEFRDFYSGNPSLNTALRSSGQHNFVFGGGFVVHLGKRKQP